MGVVEIFGGHHRPAMTKHHYLYDIERDGYSKLPEMPTARNWGTVFLYKSKIYVIGGACAPGVTSQVNEVYDRETKTWETKTPMPEPRWGATREHPVINNKVYVTHGQYPRRTYPLTNFEYDPVNDSWQNKAKPRYPRDGVANTNLRDRLHVIGGRDNHKGLSHHEVYDSKANAWITRATLPAGRADCTAVVIDGMIYVFGGYDNGTHAYPSVFEYDTEADFWIAKDPMPTARWGLSASTDGVRAYVFGGQASGEQLDVLEIFDPSKSRGKQWTAGRSMPYSAQGLMCVYVPNP